MYLFFWKVDSQKKDPRQILSQWYPCEFFHEKRRFTSAEQWMMYQKALYFAHGHHKLFNLDIADQILKSRDSKKIKSLGRKVRGFDENKWQAVRKNVVYQGNLLKFTQNRHFAKYLISLQNQILVEASPFDRIWGIGYDEQNALQNINNWGENLLGQCLMKVRDRLLDN